MGLAELNIGLLEDTAVAKFTGKLSKEDALTMSMVEFQSHMHTMLQQPRPENARLLDALDEATSAHLHNSAREPRSNLGIRFQ